MQDRKSALKSHFKSILSDISNMRFYLLIGMEFLFFLLLVLKALSSNPYSLSIPLTDFQIGSHSNISLSQNCLTITDGGKLGDSFTLTTERHSLNSGCYEVTVHYASDVDGAQKLSSSAGTLTISSSHGAKASSFILDDAHETATGRLWVPIGSKTDDLVAQLRFHGTGALKLYSIEFREALIYRMTRLMGFFLLFALIDLFIYVFFVSKLPKKNWTPHIVLISLVAISSIVFVSDLMIGGHDYIFHAMRITGVAQALHDGQFPVRMMTELCNGYSYPASIYYGDLFLYLPAILYNCMVPMHACYKIYAICVNAATCLIAYFSFKKITGSRDLGLIGAALYTLSVYRIVDLYLRAAVGEYTAMAFLPLAILGMYLIYTEKRLGWRQWLPLSLGMAGVIMSHILTAEMTAFFLGAACLFNIRKTLHPARLLAFLKAAVVCALLCAWFLVPFLEYYLTQETKISGRFSLIQDSGLYPFQIFSMFFDGIGSNVWGGVKDEMPLSIGSSLTIGIICVLYCLLKESEWEIHAEVRSCVRRELFILALMAIAFTMWCFPWTQIQLASGIAARLISPLGWSWRFLVPATALLIPAILLSLAEMQRYQRSAYLLSVFSICAAVAISFGFFCYRYTSDKSLSTGTTLTNRDLANIMGAEYLLKGSDVNTFQTARPEVVSGTVGIHYEKNAGVSYLYVANNTSAEGIIEIPVFAYRHYQAVGMEDGQRFPILTGSGNKIMLKIPGNYQGGIEVRFVPPVYWRISELLSAATLAILLLCTHCGSRCPQKRRKNFPSTPYPRSDKSQI